MCLRENICVWQREMEKKSECVRHRKCAWEKIFCLRGKMCPHMCNAWETHTERERMCVWEKIYVSERKNMSIYVYCLRDTKREIERICVREINVCMIKRNDMRYEKRLYVWERGIICIKKIFFIWNPTFFKRNPSTLIWTTLFFFLLNNNQFHFKFNFVNVK